jgi:N-ethylmaleimide reductase
MPQRGDPVESALFAPYRLGALTLRNRMVMAPMSRNRADAEDAAHALTATYYAQRACAGLIVTEAAPISPAGRTVPRAPGIYTARQIEGWRMVTRSVHAAGGRIFLQLWHAGRVSQPSVQPGGAAPVAPSAIAPPGGITTADGMVPFVTPRALAGDEIRAIVGEFAAAARNAQAAGFDGVELHAANGYLIDQFLRDGTNRRSDAYGGAPENRGRLLLDVVDAVGAALGRERVGVRLSPASALFGMADSDPQRSFGYFAAALNGRTGFLHVDETSDQPFDWRSFRGQFHGVYIANGGYDRERAIAAIDSGHADLVSFGRPFLANPDLVARFHTGAPLNAADRATFYGGDARGYTDYPSMTVEGPPAA